MNPVNEYLGEIFESIFEDFIAAGYVRFVYGGGDVGEYLTAHVRYTYQHKTHFSRARWGLPNDRRSR